MLNVESMLAVVDSRSDGVPVTCERLEERLSMWLGQDAVVWGCLGDVSLRIIHQTHELRSSVHGMASTAKTTNDQLAHLWLRTLAIKNSV